MSPASDPQQIARLAHRGALGLLAGCAVLVGLLPVAFPEAFPQTDTSRFPDPVFPYTAIALGVGAIGCRQRAVSNARHGRTTLGLSIACFALAAGIGILGLVLFWVENLQQPALLYSVGGAILALRSPFSKQVGADRDDAGGKR